MQIRRIGRRRAWTAPLLAMMMVAATLIAGVGGQATPASAADDCTGYIYSKNSEAKASFKDECGRSWNDQVRDQCTWVSSPANGWVCHTYAPNGPSNPQTPSSNNSSNSNPQPEAPKPSTPVEVDRPSSNVCMGYVYTSNGNAKTSFKNECGRSWNDKVRDQCTWVSRPANGWVCHTYAPNGPSNPQTPPSTTPSNPSASSSNGGASARSTGQTDVSGYWTSTRMRQATDVMSRSSASTRMQPPPQPEFPDYVPLSVRRTTGRVFFTLPGREGDASCSASVVRTAGKNTVWTAGHCVHIDNAWVTNWMFVPGYRDGEAPYGRWTAKQLWSLKGWTKGGNTGNSCGVSFNSGDIRYDLGVAVLHPLNGRKIVDVVGGNEIRLNPPTSGYSESYAYEKRSGVDGCSGSPSSESNVAKCSSQLDTFGRPGFLAVTCLNFGPGSSGGGIFTTQSGVRYLSGIISHSDPNRAGVLYSPYFDQGATNLYNATKNL